MIRLIFLTIALSISTLLIGQNRIAFRCEDFTCQGKPCEDGRTLSKFFALALSNSSLPVSHVTRENLDVVFSKEAEERNLSKDSGKDVKKPTVATADYFVRGNYIKQDGGNSFWLYVEFVSIKNPDVTKVEKSFGFSFTSEEMSNLDPKVCNEKFKKELEQLKWDGRVGFINEEQFRTIQNLDSTVATLQQKTIQNDKIVQSLSNSVERLSKENEQKGIELQVLKEQMLAVSDYSEVAKLNVQGKPNDGNFYTQNPLINMMEKVWIQKENFFEVDLSSEEIALKAVKESPKFPFSYYALYIIYNKKNDLKWVDFATKAYNILTFTTKIDGHNTNHDELFKNLKFVLNK